MKGNITFAILLILSLILSTSCVKDNIITNNDNNIANVVNLRFSFTFEDEEITRAVSDGTQVDILYYAIVDESGKLLNKNVRELRSNELASKTISMNLTLSAGVSYRAVFWVQNSECDAYTFSDDMSVTVDYTGANNDEIRDAFYGVSNLFTTTDGIVKVVLKRPFAQLNAGTYPFDWTYAQEYHKFAVTKSAARIRNLPNKISLIDGSVSGKNDAEFYASPIPQEKLLADIDNNGINEEYIYLSMSYVLAGEEPSTHNVDFYFMDDNNRSVMFVNEQLSSVTLQRNAHTDFVGQVLTNNGTLNYTDYISAENVYYNVSEDTIISDKTYNMTGHGAIRFASENGQKVTLNNIYITGDIWTIELGEYRGSSYVNYNNELNNVVFEELHTTSIIECHEWYFSPAAIAYGNSVLNNCVMTGSTTENTQITDKHGIEHDIIPVDIGIRNESDAIINGGHFDNVFAWTHAVVDIFGATIGTLYNGTCDSTKHSWMTIHSGTQIDSIICCEPRCPYGTKEYSTTMTIKKGAKVGSLQLVSTDVEFLIIEDGAQVDKITCNGIEYTYKELRLAMGL
ncbi:MAG: hypothetical protein IIW06_07305 [Bacteroidaceae bacterium]|nr:hypothetical protein [Bacteroidaceae bacterium]